MAARPPEAERVLQLKSVRDAGSRGLLLSAIRELGKDGPAFSRERLDGLLAAEEHFQALLLYDQLEFLRGPAAIGEADRDFALNVQRICLEAANGFQRFLRSRDSWVDGAEATSLMHRVTGLALNAIHCFVKWGYFLAEPGRAAPWKQMHALYLLADAEGYSQVAFALHATRPSFKPSVQSLYLRTLILDLLNTGNLTRVQMEIADGWFAAWCGDYALDTEYSPRRHVFYVDLASDSGMHVIRRDGQGETLRYIRAEGLESQIEDVQAGLRQGRLYAGHGAGAVFAVEHHVALLAAIEKLQGSLVAGVDNRIEERMHFDDREVDAALGFERIMRKVRDARTEPGADGGLPKLSVADAVDFPVGAEPAAAAQTAVLDGPAVDPDLERWRVHDLSSKGFGLLVDRAASENLVLNGLVAIRNNDTGGWICGNVVRKMANRGRGEVLVGLEVLAHRCIPIELRAPGADEPLAALYLPGQDPSGRQDSILLGSGDFTPNHAFGIALGVATYRVRLNRIIARGSDWIKARFEVESKD
jgi:hypothetical protein